MTAVCPFADLPMTLIKRTVWYLKMQFQKKGMVFQGNYYALLAAEHCNSCPALGL